MPTFRRALTAPLNDFKKEIKRLKTLDAENQLKFAASTGRSGGAGLSKRQLHMLTESIFLLGFRAYENFIRDIFLLYCMEKPVPSSNMKVTSYLRPRDFLHAEQLIQSSMQFLDWSTPETVIERADTYLQDGFPVKLPFTSSRETLLDMKKIRNHIAHNSPQSLQQYRSVLKKHYTVLPLVTPVPGDFLLQKDRRVVSKYKLQTYFDSLLKIADDLT